MDFTVEGRDYEKINDYFTVFVHPAVIWGNDLASLAIRIAGDIAP
jgi:hypothetical protein